MKTKFRFLPTKEEAEWSGPGCVSVSESFPSLSSSQLCASVASHRLYPENSSPYKNYIGKIIMKDMFPDPSDDKYILFRNAMIYLFFFRNVKQCQAVQNNVALYANIWNSEIIFYDYRNQLSMNQWINYQWINYQWINYKWINYQWINDKWTRINESMNQWINDQWSDIETFQRSPESRRYLPVSLLYLPAGGPRWSAAAEWSTLIGRDLSRLWSDWLDHDDADVSSVMP